MIMVIGQEMQFIIVLILLRLKIFLGNVTKVVSKFPEMEEGVFFVNRLNKNQFQLATSPANILIIPLFQYLVL